MKLALIRRSFSATGGAELYLQRLLAGLVREGHEVDLFAEKWEGQADGVQFKPVPITKAPRSERAARFAINVRRVLSPEDYHCVFSLERTIQQDVYRAGDGLHRVWLERRRQFARWWWRPFIGHTAFHRRMQKLEALTFDPANTRHIIVNSDMVRGEIAQHFPAFPQERIHLVRNGVDPRRFQGIDRNAARQRLGLSEDDFVLLFVGSGWERKGLPWLLKYMAAQAHDPALKLLAVTRDRVRGPRSPQIVLPGPMKDIEQAYAAADLLVFLPIYEPCSNVVSEALASGIPVITSSQNGAAELICPGLNGHVLDDPRDLATLGAHIAHWRVAGRYSVQADVPLDIETNVQNTLRVLELAAADRTRRDGQVVA
jgi:UDP-glucose:(heptosyl)LPS alpha-1,3-glucosyltransferase